MYILCAALKKSEIYWNDWALKNLPYTVFRTILAIFKVFPVLLDSVFAVLMDDLSSAIHTKRMPHSLQGVPNCGHERNFVYLEKTHIECV